MSVQKKQQYWERGAFDSFPAGSLCNPGAVYVGNSNYISGMLAAWTETKHPGFSEKKRLWRFFIAEKLSAEASSLSVPCDLKTKCLKESVFLGGFLDSEYTKGCVSRFSRQLTDVYSERRDMEKWVRRKVWNTRFQSSSSFSIMSNSGFLILEFCTESAKEMGMAVWMIWIWKQSVC